MAHFVGDVDVESDLVDILLITGGTICISSHPEERIVSVLIHGKADALTMTRREPMPLRPRAVGERPEPKHRKYLLPSKNRISNKLTGCSQGYHVVATQATAPVSHYLP